MVLCKLGHFFPIQYPDIAFSYGIIGNVKPLVKDVHFKAGYNSEAHLGEREKGERRQRISRLYSAFSPCLLDIMHFLQFDCPSVGIFTKRDH